jgi:hypothetical protein
MPGNYRNVDKLFTRKLDGFFVCVGITTRPQRFCVGITSIFGTFIACSRASNPVNQRLTFPDSIGMRAALFCRVTMKSDHIGTSATQDARNDVPAYAHDVQTRVHSAARRSASATSCIESGTAVEPGRGLRFGEPVVATSVFVDAQGTAAVEPKKCPPEKDF